MSTKVIILDKGQPKAKRRPIEFVKYIAETDLVTNDGAYSISEFKYIELIARNYTDTYDLMFAYNDPNKRGEDGIAFLGYFNDGIV